MAGVVMDYDGYGERQEHNFVGNPLSEFRHWQMKGHNNKKGKDRVKSKMYYNNAEAVLGDATIYEVEMYFADPNNPVTLDMWDKETFTIGDERIHESQIQWGVELPVEPRDTRDFGAMNGFDIPNDTTIDTTVQLEAAG